MQPHHPGTTRHHRIGLAGAALVLGLALLSACSNAPPAPPPARTAPAEVRQVLAPTGVLRIAVYPGSPTSLLPGATPADARGVTVDVGRLVAQRLGVPAELVVLPRVAEVVAALKAGRADLTITNATPARAAEVDFTAPLLGLELGFLVPAGSAVQTADAIDRPGMRVGVSQGSSSQAALTQRFKAASVVPQPTLQAAAEALQAGRIDAFATNKGILFELADGLPGARVLDGRWGLEHLAIAVPPGRRAAQAWLQVVAADLVASGAVQQAAQRAGLRGTAAPAAP